MTGSLDGRVAVITGGSTGIGLATAARFVAEGASVVIVGRRQAELDKAVAELGGDTIGVRADVSRPGDLDRLYERVAAERGRIDVLFANASIAQGGSLGSLTEEGVDRHLDINIKGLVFTVEKALPLIPDGGSIIVTSSVDDVKGGPGRSVYAATKAAARNLVRSWMQELSHRDIRVNADWSRRHRDPGWPPWPATATSRSSSTTSPRASPAAATSARTRSPPRSPSWHRPTPAASTAPTSRWTGDSHRSSGPPHGPGGAIRRAPPTPGPERPLPERAERCRWTVI